MPWMISVDSLEKLVREVECRLYACGHDEAVSILLHGFAERRRLTYVPDKYVEDLQGCYLSLLSVDGMVGTTNSVSNKGDAT